MSDRVFLDANILVSAAWRADNGLLALWKLTDVDLLTSAYAIVEADRNVRTPEQRTRLHRLVQSVEIVDEPRGRTLPAGVRLAIEPRRLRDTEEAAADPFWPPDSRQIGYFGGGSLKIVDIAGDAPARVIATCR